MAELSNEIKLLKENNRKGLLTARLVRMFAQENAKLYHLLDLWSMSCCKSCMNDPKSESFFKVGLRTQDVGMCFSARTFLISL